VALTDQGMTTLAALDEPLVALHRNIGVIVLPDQIAVAKAHEAFHADGSLKDPKQQTGIEGLGKTLSSFLAKLKT